MSDTTTTAVPAASPDLSALIRAVARRERSALEALYHTYRQAIFTVALSVTRDWQEAEDVLQDTLLYVWEHASAYRWDGHPRAWLCTIARHLAIDRLRKNQRTVLLESWDHVADTSPGACARLLEADLALAQAIGQLPPLESQVVMLSAFAGLSHGEIATLLGLPYHKARYRYRRAIAKLRTLLLEPD